MFIHLKSKSKKVDVEAAEEHNGAVLNKAIRKLSIKGLLNTDEICDRYVSFGDLYTQKLILTIVLFNLKPELAWKSRAGGVSKGHFVAGITTPKGEYCYCCKNEYWDYFKVKTVVCAPDWDRFVGQSITYLLSLLDGEEEKNNVLLFVEYNALLAKKGFIKIEEGNSLGKLIFTNFEKEVSITFDMGKGDFSIATKRETIIDNEVIEVIYKMMRLLNADKGEK